VPRRLLIRVQSSLGRAPSREWQAARAQRPTPAECCCGSAGSAPDGHWPEPPPGRFPTIAALSSPLYPPREPGTAAPTAREGFPMTVALPALTVSAVRWPSSLDDQRSETGMNPRLAALSAALALSRYFDASAIMHCCSRFRPSKRESVQCADEGAFRTRLLRTDHRGSRDSKSRASFRSGFSFAARECANPRRTRASRSRTNPVPTSFGNSCDSAHIFAASLRSGQLV
jgi:hypothetical protein